MNEEGERVGELRYVETKERKIVGEGRKGVGEAVQKSILDQRSVIFGEAKRVKIQVSAFECAIFHAHMHEKVELKEVLNSVAVGRETEEENSWSLSL
jgi:hypothetical protein